MSAFKIEPKILPAYQPLQEYQSGKADDFQIVCRDGSFGVHLYCLFNSEFLYSQYKARENFEGQENKKFDWSLFRKETIKIYFDGLYGLPKENMVFHQAIEFIALLHFDGKIDQNSTFETDVCKVVIDQMINSPGISPRTLALCWLYCQVHATNPLGQFIKPVLSAGKLWVFDRLDLKDAVTLLLLNYKDEKNQNDLELKKLISMQFENELEMKIWAMTFFDKEAINLPKRVTKQPIFIHIDSRDPDFCALSGKYKFHDVKSGRVAFIREGGKLKMLEPHPYYFARYSKTWAIQSSERFDKNESNHWIGIVTEETDFLSLGSTWEVATQPDLGETEPSKATVKIFTNEIEFKNFNECKRKKG